MARLGLETAVVDAGVYERTLGRFREAGIRLPTFGELRDPKTIPASVKARLASVDADAPDPLNLFRVHWYNDAERRGFSDLPAYVEIPSELSGVKARIVLIVGNRFPMIHAHKVLAAYGCLAPRVVTGQFDPTRDRAIWPSTGNYCRGGVAISRIMQCRGVAVLPENMSQERFDWLDRWVVEHSDVIRTPGSESNVKEIYDACNLLDKTPGNIIFNQFCEFGNYLVHRVVTGSALEKLYNHVTASNPKARLAAYVSATGSAGTLAAGDHLKKQFGCKIVAVEAAECPTLLENGFGEHNIQGIGDKHVPYIHNAMNTDMIVAVPEAATDTLDVLFNTETGHEYLADRRGIAAELIEQLKCFGLSSLCNLIAAIKTAKHYDLGADDVVVTVATDGAAMYNTERTKSLKKYFGNRFDAVAAGETFGRVIGGSATDRMLELTQPDRRRIFNLGYFTWVEQQGVEIADFQARRDPAFWEGLLDLVPAWDAMIGEFNAKTGVTA